MPSFFRVDEDVMRAFRMSEYPARLAKLSDDLAAVHDVYHTHQTIGKGPQGWFIGPNYKNRRSPGAILARIDSRASALCKNAPF